MTTLQEVLTILVAIGVLLGGLSHFIWRVWKVGSAIQQWSAALSANTRAVDRMADQLTQIARRVEHLENAAAGPGGSLPRTS